MNIPFIFTSGIIVVILFFIGLIYTFREFNEMNEHPEEYRKDTTSGPTIVEKDSAR
ncbi:MAG TPA: hypothetical protein VKM37_09190 [Balneolaceae bacterium]|nr:hypothetical protein [Balneolaceae bacterium]